MFKNTIINMFGILIPGVLAIPGTAYLARQLDVECFGLLLLAYSVLGYSSIFDAGLTRAVIRKIAQTNSIDIERLIMGTAITSVLAISIFGLSVLAVFSSEIISLIHVSDVNRLEAIRSLWIICITIPFLLVGSIAFSYLEGKQLFYKLNSYKVITSSVLVISPVVFVIIYKTLLSAVLGLFLARVIFAVVGIFSLNLEIKKFRFAFKFYILKDLFSFGGWITLSNIISPIMVYADRFILANSVGASKVAYYNAPSDLIEKISIIPGALSRTIFPLFSQDSKNINKHEYIAHLGLAIVLASIITPVFIFSESIINFWLGSEYAAKSSIILKILLIGFFFNGLAQIPFAKIQAVGRSKITALLHLAEVLPYLVALFYLLKMYGLIGAACAWTCRMLFDFLLLRYISSNIENQ